ncbi:MAG TPA: AAA family ATPase [Actinomycetes bacterium]|nr:AAA family ATPase [Actinomycetes bacterium]
MTITGMDLWEREGALVALEGELRRSAGGGRVALVAGEAGIGKSSVVTEFTRRAATTARVLWGACDQLVTPRALGPLHDIGRATGGVLAQRLADTAGPQEIYSAFLDEVTDPQQRHRALVVVEDAHWADEATLDWLTFLGRRITRLPVLLVVTYRDDEVGPDHPLRRVLAAMPADVTSRVVLSPLSEERVLEEAARAGRDPRLVRRLAGGNPLLVTELLKDPGNDAPTAVQDLILDRLRHLPAAARDLAHLVAVVPTRTDDWLVAAALEDRGDGEAPVDVAIAAGVLVPAGATGDGLGYRHEILRQAVERSMSPTRRAGMHAAVLAALEGQGAERDVDPGRLVHHALGAGDPDAVLRYAQVAGDLAARQGAHREAAAHYVAATEHAHRLPDEEQAELVDHAAMECYLVGRFQESLDLWRRGADLREQTGDLEGMGNDLGWVGRLLWWAGNTAQALAVSEHATEVLEALPPSPALARVYGQLARLHLTAHRAGDTLHFGQKSVDLAKELGDTGTYLHSRMAMATARAINGDLSAVTDLAELAVEADDAGYTEVAARALINVASMTPDELAEYGPVAVDRFATCERYVRRHDMDGFLEHLNGARARMHLERGDWTEALSYADGVLASRQIMPMNAVLPLMTKARVAAARGAPDAEQLLLEAAAATADIEDIAMQAPVADGLAELYIWRGEDDKARQVLRDALVMAGRTSQNEFIVGRLAWRLHQAGGDDPLPEVAAAPFRDMAEGRWAEAAAEWGRRGATYLRAMALVQGDETAAAEGLRILDGLGAVKPAEHARAGMRARGMTRVPRGPRRSTASNAAGLTEREAEVLALVTEGLTNAEISRRLTLSPKTVGHHISAILAKLGVSSRGQAAAAAHRLDLVP